MIHLVDKGDENMHATRARELYSRKNIEPDLDVIFTMIAQRAKLGHVILGVNNLTEENLKELKSLGYSIKEGRQGSYYICWL